MGDGCQTVAGLHQLGHVPGERFVDTECASDVLRAGGVCADTVVEPDEGGPESADRVVAILFECGHERIPNKNRVSVSLKHYSVNQDIRRHP